MQKLEDLVSLIGNTQTYFKTQAQRQVNVSFDFA